MKLTDFLADVGRPVAYFPALKKITGSTVAAIFVAQFVYWTGKQEDPNGWIFKTQEEIEDETGLSRSEQETARRQLKSRGLLEEEYRGIPRKLYYRINTKKMNEEWERIPRKPAKNNNNAGIQHYCMLESSRQERDNPADYTYYTETTQETTTTHDPVVVPSEGELKELHRLLDRKIPISALGRAIRSYRPEAHADYQPETPVQGIRRIIGWMSHMNPPPKNPSGFLIEMSRKGMDKPAAVIRAEQAKEAERQEQERRRKERERLEALRAEREIPPEARRFLDEFMRAAV